MFISLDHLGKDFRKKPCALDDLTLDLPSGMIGLVGPNGAGKTTLMRILCGIVAPTRGRVLADGRDLSDARARRALKRTLGYLPQDIEPYPNLTPLEFLDYMGVLKGMGDARERRRQAGGLLERVGLADVARRRIGGFSGGMRRRVGIAQALMGDPRLLVVDELGRLELERGCGLVAATELLARGATARFPHALAVVRDWLLPRAVERFGAAWGGARAISPDDGARGLVRAACGLAS
ncbi:putative ABC transporter ATP-binding protein YxlF [Coriobacteriaceae bacterium CHKCI002]|nr:putative ABC transporter ATP-binding protein YxlF [Coriobacteriaceae bacterium CHKCI002]